MKAKQLLQYEKEGVELKQYAKGAVIFGATGLIGTSCLHHLLHYQAYDKVISIGRRALSVHHPKLTHYTVDLNDSDHYRHLMKGDDLFICLGTTLKKAGSKEAFYGIDHDLMFDIAKTGSLQNMNQLILVSSVGADKSSFVFYLKVKGELEDDVRRLPFWSVQIMRPSVLLGKRNEKRVAEKIAGRLSKGLQYFSGSILGDIAPVEADDVAKAMIQSAQGLKKGTFIHHGSEIVQLAKQFDK